MGGQKGLGQFDKFFLFMRGEGLFRASFAQILPGFYLYEDQGVTFAHHEVDFAPAGTPVAGQEAVTLKAKIPGGKVFG